MGSKCLSSLGPFPSWLSWRCLCCFKEEHLSGQLNLCWDLEVWAQYWIEVMGFVQEKAFTAPSLMQKRNEEWRPTQNMKAFFSYLWILSANLSHSAVIPVEIWICLLSVWPLLCITICFSKIVSFSSQPTRPKCLVFTFVTSSQIVLTELTLIFLITW